MMVAFPEPTALAYPALLAQAPLPTAAPTLINRALGHALEARQTYNPYSGFDDSCVNYNAAVSCDKGYVNCILSAGGTGGTDYTAINAGYSSCYCDYGFDYVNCYLNALSTKNCYDFYGITDLGGFASSWFVDFCGTIPPSVFAKLPVPTIVSLSFAPVTIVTPTTPLPPPIPHTDPPLYSGNGNILQSTCGATSFTLVDVGSTVYLAGFVGCVSDRPECCPWTVAGSDLKATADTTVTVSVTAAPGSPGPADGSGGSGSDGNRVAFPVAADQAQQVLKACPDDYYTVSGGGGCCPSQYFPFTRAIGGITPCWSSLPRVTTPPTLTAGLQGQPSDTAKPTSAVVNIVWAMQYGVGKSGGAGGLSTGAIVGIAVGAAVGVIAIAVLAFLLWRSKRKNKKAAAAAAANPNGVQQNGVVPLGQQQPQMTYNAAGQPMGMMMPPPGGPQQLAPMGMMPPGGMLAAGYSQQQLSPHPSQRVSLLSNATAPGAYTHPGHASITSAGSAGTPSSYLSQMPTGSSQGVGTLSELSPQGSGSALVGGGQQTGYFPPPQGMAEMPYSPQPMPELQAQPTGVPLVWGPPMTQPQWQQQWQPQPQPQFHQPQFHQQPQQPVYGFPPPPLASTPPFAGPVGPPPPPQEMGVQSPVIARKSLPPGAGAGGGAGGDGAGGSG